MADIDRLIDFVRFTNLIRGVKRAVILSDGQAENDAEHSYQLALSAWYLIDKEKLPLDKFRAACMAMVHDIVEAYAGDIVIFASSEELEAQYKKEAEAMARIKNEWPEFKSLHELIDEYEQQSSEEAKFVYALDKLVPIINNYICGGVAWKKHKQKLENIKSLKVGKIDRSKVVNDYYNQLVKILEKHPELFGEKG